MPGPQALRSLFEFAATCGLARASADIDFDSREPCDDSLCKLINQSARLVTSKCRRDSEEFSPSSNYAALLALCWLVAKFSLPELLLREAVASLDAPKQKRGKEEAKLEAKGADAPGSIAEECKLIAFKCGRLRASMKGLSASTQQLMSLTHQVHRNTVGISLSDDMNHLTLSQVGYLASPAGGQFQMEVQRAFQAVTSYTEWKRDEPEFWTWIESQTVQMPLHEELECFQAQIEWMRSEVDFGVVETRPRLVLEPGSNAGLAQVDAEMRSKLAAVEKEFCLKRDRLKEALTNLGLQYQDATFMP